MKHSIRILAIIIVLILIQLPLIAGGKRLHKEKEYQECWCVEAGGVTEYVLADKTRVDCLTDEYAIEFDFADKWAEAIGQSLHYAQLTGRKPGIALIIEHPEDRKHLKKLEPIAIEHSIKIWIIENE
jgi:hypothetical protein